MTNIKKDESPIAAIKPQKTQQMYLEILIKEATEYAWLKGYTDFCFQGYNSYKYFCAYTTKVIRKGTGEFVFGFERKKDGLFFTFSDRIPEPKKISTPWTQKSEVHRVKILLPDDAAIEYWAYIVHLAKNSIDYSYSLKTKSKVHKSLTV